LAKVPVFSSTGKSRCRIARIEMTENEEIKTDIGLIMKTPKQGFGGTVGTRTRAIRNTKAPKPMPGGRRSHEMSDLSVF
jgi:hypothetical protein